MATTKEYRLGEFTYPRGWFMVGRSEDATTVPAAVRYFGEDLVLYRGHSGKVYMMEAYCPHMGTHLATNTTSYVVLDRTHVEGDNIRCPYHAWRFGPDGKCNEIPYSPGTPPKKACLKSWPITERAGCLWTWYDPEGQEADYPLPEFPQWEDPSWVNWEIAALGTLNSHPQEVVDNMADKGHLSFVHGSRDIEYFENEFDGHTCRQILKAGHRTLMSNAEGMTNDTWYVGPAILQSVMVGDYPSHMLIAHTPVDDGVIMVWYGLFVKSPHPTPTGEDVAFARSYAHEGVKAFAQDFEIWGNKRPCINPMMVRGDGPFDKVRIWYKQFFNPRAEAHTYQERVNGHFVSRGTLRDPWEDA